ncbi:MAG: SprT family zinc-dependent metalloprotease [Longimicrobiales bacterium]|nr:SprT family zinc-dependent metalloprotease [Longimicrobiales bacterium]
MRTTEDFLQELRRRGATGLRRVRFRENRRTLWSLTRGGRALNVHAAYRGAPDTLLDAFALLVREGGIASEASRRAARRLREWPPLREAVREARARYARRRRNGHEKGHCCGTEAQRRYLHALFDYFNATRFGNGLPGDIPLRLSRRMTSALGHMRPGKRQDGVRYVAEIALNVDLMLEGNGAERVDTLLHEMAHAADYLESGHRGHGPSWRVWARRVGCSPRTLHERPVRYRSRRQDVVDRTPPLPTVLYTRQRDESTPG